MSRRSARYGFWDAPLGGRPFMTTASILGPLTLLGLFLWWQWILLAYGAFVLGWAVYHLARHYWRVSPAGRTHDAREAAVRDQLQRLRAERFERLHGIPMPAGYGYYAQVTPGHDTRDVRHAR